jgi:hypothetical protein
VSRCRAAFEATEIPQELAILIIVEGQLQPYHPSFLLPRSDEK